MGLEHDSSALKVKVIQFGWICRDYTFSVECEEGCSDRCHIAFNPERRQIRLHLRFLTEFYLIVISFASINTVSTSTNLDRDHALVFYLNVPPSYEKEQVSGKRLKLSHLPIPGHERVAPFTSMAIRIVCGSQKDIRQFRRLCSIAHLNKVDEYDYPVDHRDLFALTDMLKMQNQLCQLPWIVAFQMEALLRNMKIDFKEANTLYPVVAQMAEDKGEQFVAYALRSFGNQTDDLFYSEDEVAIDVVGLFTQTVDELDRQGILIPPHPTDGSLYQAFHVDVTPTTMHFDGPFTEQSNRVIRTYDATHHDCFLRVSFVDEALLHYRFDHEIDGRAFITSRIGPLLYNGLKIAGRWFDFLAYSQSALREHAVWSVIFCRLAH
jgi:RNA-dependent RNA polymerase